VTEQADQGMFINAPAHSTALVQAFFGEGKTSHRLGLAAPPPYSPDLVLCDFWLSTKLKSPLKGKRFVNATVTPYTSSVNGVSLPTD